MTVLHLQDGNAKAKSLTGYDVVIATYSTLRYRNAHKKALARRLREGTQSSRFVHALRRLGEEGRGAQTASARLSPSCEGLRACNLQIGGSGTAPGDAHPSANC